MTEQELNLFQFSSGGVAEPGTGAAHVVRSQLLQSDPFRRILHDMPDSFLGHAFAQDPAHLRHPTEDLLSVDPCGVQPDAQFFHYTAGYWNRADVSCLALQIDNGPMFLPLFQMFDPEINGFVATQTAGKQQSKKCTVSFALEPFRVRGLP